MNLDEYFNVANKKYVVLQCHDEGLCIIGSSNISTLHGDLKH